MGSTLTFAHFTVVNMIFGFQHQLRGDILKLYPHPRQRHDFFLHIVFQPSNLFFFSLFQHLWTQLLHFSQTLMSFRTFSNVLSLFGQAFYTIFLFSTVFPRFPFIYLFSKKDFFNFFAIHGHGFYTFSNLFFFSF